MRNCVIRVTANRHECRRAHSISLVLQPFQSQHVVAPLTSVFLASTSVRLINILSSKIKRRLLWESFPFDYTQPESVFVYKKKCLCSGHKGRVGCILVNALNWNSWHNNNNKNGPTLPLRLIDQRSHNNYSWTTVSYARSSLHVAQFSITLALSR